MCRAHSRWLWLFRDGLVYQGTSGDHTVYRWPDVTVRREIRLLENRDGKEYKEWSFVIRGAGGRALSLDKHDSGLSNRDRLALGALIEHETVACRLPAMLASVRDGGSVRFGALRVDAAGISNGTTQVPWAWLEDIDIDDSVIWTKQRSGWIEWPELKITSVPYLPCSRPSPPNSARRDSSSA